MARSLTLTLICDYLKILGNKSHHSNTTTEHCIALKGGGASVVLFGYCDTNGYFILHHYILLQRGKVFTVYCTIVHSAFVVSFNKRRHVC